MALLNFVMVRDGTLLGCLSMFDEGMANERRKYSSMYNQGSNNEAPVDHLGINHCR
jgi:hypothetical protein